MVEYFLFFELRVFTESFQFVSGFKVRVSHYMGEATVWSQHYI